MSSEISDFYLIFYIKVIILLVIEKEIVYKQTVLSEKKIDFNKEDNYTSLQNK